MAARARNFGKGPGARVGVTAPRETSQKGQLGRGRCMSAPTDSMKSHESTDLEPALVNGSLAALQVPPNLGRLMSATQVAEELFHGTVSPTWVRRNVPHKITLGHSTVRWWEADVLRWLEIKKGSIRQHATSNG